MIAWTAASVMLVGSTTAFLQYELPWLVYGVIYYSILAIPILFFDGLCIASFLAPHLPLRRRSRHPKSPVGHRRVLVTRMLVTSCDGCWWSRAGAKSGRASAEGMQAGMSLGRRALGLGLRIDLIDLVIRSDAS